MNNTKSGFGSHLSQSYDKFSAQSYYEMFPKSVMYYLQKDVDIHGKSIFDVGCGNGDLSKRIAEAGASYVLGVDLSDHQIAIAKKKNAHSNIEFKVEDAYQIHVQQSSPFDAVVCMYAFHFIPDQKTLDLACENLYKNLKDNGSLVFLDITHDYRFNRNLMNKLKELTYYEYAPKAEEGDVPELWSRVEARVYDTQYQSYEKIHHYAIHGQHIMQTMAEIGFRDVQRVPILTENELYQQIWGETGFNHHLIIAKK